MNNWITEDVKKNTETKIKQLINEGATFIFLMSQLKPELEGLSEDKVKDMIKLVSELWTNNNGMENDKEATKSRDKEKYNNILTPEIQEATVELVLSSIMSQIKFDDMVEQAMQLLANYSQTEKNAVEELMISEWARKGGAI